MSINQFIKNKDHGVPIIEIRRISDMANNNNINDRTFEVIHYNDAFMDCFNIPCFDDIYYLSDLFSARNMKLLKKHILRKGADNFLLKTDKNYNNKVDHLICYLIHNDEHQTISVMTIPVEKKPEKTNTTKIKN